MGSGKEKRKSCKISIVRKRGHSFVIVAFVLAFVVGSQILGIVEAATGESENGKNTPGNNVTKNSDGPPVPVSQVRYRNRPVAAFRSNNSSTKSSNNNSSNESSIAGVPSFAVHDLTSQTFEKLHENWRNLETFLRNLQVRRSQEESQRASSQSRGDSVSHLPSGTNSRENFGRLPQYPSGNVYTLRYHPVLEGQGSSSSSDDDFVKTHRNHNHFNFNPYPYDPKGQGSKDVDMERHTIATIYTIGICLTIMAIGSVMFILINKCDGSQGGTSYIRSGGGGGAGTRPAAMQSRIARGMLDAMGVGAANSRTAAGRQGRTRRTGGGRTSGGNNNNNNEGGAVGGVLSETDAKILTDLPPSYESLFPEGAPNLKVIVEPEPEPSTSTRTVTETNINLSSSDMNNLTSTNGSISSNTPNQNANSSTNTV